MRSPQSDGGFYGEGAVSPRFRLLFKRPHVVQMNRQFSAGARQMPFVGLAFKTSKFEHTRGWKAAARNEGAMNCYFSRWSQCLNRHGLTARDVANWASVYSFPAFM